MPQSTTIIIRASALVNETRILLAHWDRNLSVDENLDLAKRINIFSKSSRRRIADLLAVFKKRYFRDSEVAQALAVLFLLSLPEVERLFIEAHQENLLSYHAAGSITHITFPTEDPEEYARAITERANRVA